MRLKITNLEHYSVVEYCYMCFCANEKYILLFKYARYILKPDKLKHEGPIGFGYDPEKRNKILFPAKKKEKHFLDNITPLHLNANLRR